MKTIQRDLYLQELISKKENGMIKVVTGIRRCGKSYLLFELYRNFLLSIGVREENIIMLALDGIKNAPYRDPMKLSEYVTSKVADKSQMYYVFIDEIQYAIKKEELKSEEPLPLYGVLNGFLHLGNVDVYVIGSNSQQPIARCAAGCVNSEDNNDSSGLFLRRRRNDEEASRCGNRRFVRNRFQSVVQKNV